MTYPEIVGYTFQAEQYTPAGLIERMVTIGELSPAARDMRPEEVLDQHAGACAIDRDDEHSFDSWDFPKVVFSTMTEGNPDTDSFVTETGDSVIL
jgi:hypothetical protein